MERRHHIAIVAATVLIVTPALILGKSDFPSILSEDGLVALFVSAVSAEVYQSHRER